MALMDLAIQDHIDQINLEKNIQQKNHTNLLKELMLDVFLKKIHPIKKFKNYSDSPFLEKIENVQCLDYLKIETTDLLKNKEFFENLFIDKNKTRLFLSNLLNPETKDIIVNILSKFEKNVSISNNEFYSIINILTYSTFNLDNPFDFDYPELMKELEKLVDCYQDNQNNQESICSYYNSFFNKKILVIGFTAVLSGLFISLGLPPKVGSVLIKTVVQSEEL
jgi:hypothetical protein